MFTADKEETVSYPQFKNKHNFLSLQIDYSTTGKDFKVYVGRFRHLDFDERVTDSVG